MRQADGKEESEEMNWRGGEKPNRRWPGARGPLGFLKPSGEYESARVIRNRKQGALKGKEGTGHLVWRDVLCQKGTLKITEKLLENALWGKGMTNDIKKVRLTLWKTGF